MHDQLVFFFFFLKSWKDYILLKGAGRRTRANVPLMSQVLYPYLLRAGGLAGVGPIQLDIVGSRMGASLPSFSYIKQIYLPNMEKQEFLRVQQSCRKGDGRRGQVKVNLEP